MRVILLLLLYCFLTGLLVAGCTQKKQSEPTTQSGGHPDEMADSTRLDPAPTSDGRDSI